MAKCRVVVNVVELDQAIRNTLDLLEDSLPEQVDHPEELQRQALMLAREMTILACKLYTNIRLQKGK